MRKMVDCIGCNKIKPEHPRIKGLCKHCGDMMEVLIKACESLGGLYKEME